MSRNLRIKHSCHLASLNSAPCACGGIIRQRVGEELTDAIRQHQATEHHQLWRERTVT
jgi:hypothetical protein